MMKRLTRTKLNERRRQVANYAFKGWTQAAIARHLNIPQVTVSRDLAAMREFWREFPIYDFQKARLEQLPAIPGQQEMSGNRDVCGRGFVNN